MKKAVEGCQVLQDLSRGGYPDTWDICCSKILSRRSRQLMLVGTGTGRTVCDLSARGGGGTALQKAVERRKVLTACPGQSGLRA